MTIKHITTPPKAQRIAVLGAGPMGLGVAYQLALEGHQPIIFEADDRLGGMTATFDFSGLQIERFYHFHCTSDQAFLRVLNELGLSDKMRWVATKMGYWYKQRLQPWGNPKALLTFKGLSMLAKLRYALHAWVCMKTDDASTLDNKRAIPWIQQWVGTEAFDVLWRRLFEYKFFDYQNQVSAAWIWSRIRRIGRSRYNLFQERLGYLEGGSETLLQALRIKIESLGGRIFLKSPVKKVVIEQACALGVELASGVQTFDQVISTVPLPYVSSLIPDLPLEIKTQLASLKSVAVVCVIVKLRQPLTDNFWLNINDPDMDIPGLIEYSNLRPLDASIVYVPFYLPAEHPKYADPDAVFLQKVKRYLQRIKPTLLDDDFIELKASRYRYAQPVCGPQFLSQLPPTVLPIKGLWVADTSYYYPEDRGISESLDFGRKLARQALALSGDY